MNFQECYIGSTDPVSSELMFGSHLLFDKTEDKLIAYNEISYTEPIDIDFLNISIANCSRIKKAEDASVGLKVPLPQIISFCNSWQASRIFAKYNYAPTFVNPIFDGGIMLEYLLNDNLYIMIEFFNDGDIVYLIKRDGKRETFSLNTLNELETLLQPILNGANLR